MKKAILMIAALALASGVFAQSKGETQFSIGGYLYDNSKSNGGGSAVWSMLPVLQGRYLMTDKIGIDGGLAYLTGKDIDAAFNLMLGGHYYWYAKDKMRMSTGAMVVFELGKGNETLDDKGKKANPMDINLDLVEAEYWPMEGGAAYANLYYNLNGMNLGDVGSKSFGIGLGIKIRLK